MAGTQETSHTSHTRFTVLSPRLLPSHWPESNSLTDREKTLHHPKGERKRSEHVLTHTSVYYRQAIDPFGRLPVEQFKNWVGTRVSYGDLQAAATVGTTWFTVQI